MSGVGDALIGGLLGGTILFALTAVATQIPFVKRRPALASAMWLVVLARFVAPLDLGGAFSIEGQLGGLFGGSVWLFPAEGAMAPAAATTLSGGGVGALEVLLGAWLVVSVLLAARTVARAMRTRHLLRACRPADASIVATAALLAKRLGLRRLPSIVVGSRTPQTHGVLAPLIAIPSWLAPEALAHVLAHELAHVKRRDTLWALIVSAAQIVLFFWPPVWIAARRFAAARERACDNVALCAAEARSGDYARTLVSISSRLLEKRHGALAMAAPPSQLGARVGDLLAGGSRAGLGALGALFLGLQLLIAVPGSAGADGAAMPWQQCVVEPGIREALTAQHPDADTNGDGFLSRDEICAHQQRLREQQARAVASDEFLEQAAPLCLESKRYCEEGDDVFDD